MCIETGLLQGVQVVCWRCVYVGRTDSASLETVYHDAVCCSQQVLALIDCIAGEWGEGADQLLADGLYLMKLLVCK